MADSDNDDPFGVSKRKGKTIVRPNPGGRWSETKADSPPPPQYTPPPPPPSYPGNPSPSGGDPWRGASGGQDPYAPTPAGYEYGQQAAPDLHRPPPGNPPFGAAPQSHRPQPQQASAALAAMPKISEIKVANRNPVARAAAPLLLLLGRLRLSMTDEQFDALMRDVYNAIKAFEAELRQSGIPDGQIRDAAYALCATSDDIVQNLPSAARHQWTQYSMLTQFFGRTIGGVEFFQLLENAKKDPGLNYGVLEVMHACLSLGFHGKYRAVQGGQQALERERQSLYEVLRRVRPRQGDDLSPHWKGLEAKQRKPGFTVPLWTIAAIGGAMLVGIYVTLMLLLSSSSEVVASRADGLYPTGPVELARANYQPKPPPALPKPPDAPVNKIAAGLQGIDGLEVIQAGPSVMLRMRAQFDVATATLQPQFKQLVEKVARTLDDVNGTMLVVGHTDSDPIRGNPRFPDNDVLSLERAKAVANVMKAVLKDPQRVSVEGRGAKEPIAPNATREGKALNRRVEVFLKTANPVVASGN